MEQLTLRERRRALIEDDILNVAQELILEKGYTAMSMDELAARVGISKPTLYGFFRTKADLVRAAAVRGMERTLARIEQVMRQEGPPTERLAAAMRTIIDHSQEGIVPMITELPDFREQMHTSERPLQLKQQMTNIIVGLIEEARAAGEIADDIDTPTIIQVFRGIIVSCFHIDPCDTLRPKSASLSQGLSTVFLRGIRTQTS